MYWVRSASEREWHERRWAEHRGQCPHCGRPRSVCSDPTVTFYPQREFCYATMEREAANAAYAELHAARKWHDGTFTSWAAERSATHPWEYSWGVTIGVAETDLRPDDLFTTHESWGPDQKPVEGELDDFEDEGDQ